MLSASRLGPRSPRTTGTLLLACGSLGLLAAVVLLIEKIALLENPDYVPTCSINPILSCGSVMTSDQASAFGFPNPIIGVAGFAVVATIGAALLAGARFERWFWVGLQLGATFALLFVHWLMYQSLYVIGALCPYCMVVWAVTIPLFVHVTAVSLQQIAREAPSNWTKLAATTTDYQGFIVTTWLVAVAVLVAERFWSYWVTLI